MDLKRLQEVVDDLEKATLRLEGMGFTGDQLDGFSEAVEAIKLAGKDSRALNSRILFSVMFFGAAITVVSSYLFLKFVIDSHLSKIDKNQEKLSQLDQAGIDLEIGALPDKRIAFRTGNRLSLLPDGKTVVLIK